MLVRSLGSQVMRWPDRDEVEAALHAWAENLAGIDDQFVAAGYFG